MVYIIPSRIGIVSIVLINAIGLGLALLVTQKLKGSNIMRTVFFMPNLIGGLILGFIWQFVFIQGFDAIGQAVGTEALQGTYSLADVRLYNDNLYSPPRRYTRRLGRGCPDRWSQCLPEV